MTHLRLALLGPFHATSDDRPIAALTAARLRALLAYLAVEAEREHNREALAGLFWPERPDQEALSALRYALSNLRRAIGDSGARPPFLRITRHTVQFNPDSDAWLDVSEFGAWAREPALQSATVEQLTSAVALYRGEFLAGLALDDSVAFEEWVLLRREHCRCQVLALLRQLAAMHEAKGDFEAAATVTRQHLATEPWDEVAHRRLMRVLALGGKRNAALAQFQECRRLLADELGVEPEDETTNLYQTIRAGSPASGGEGGAVPVLARPVPLPAQAWPARTPFVGREAEMIRLDGHLSLSLADQGRVVFVTGEAGSGKTTLLTEFARQATTDHPDLLLASGRGSAQAGVGDPYLPFREMLGQLTGGVDSGPAWEMGGVDQAQRLKTAAPWVLEVLARVGPGLFETLVPRETLARLAETAGARDAAWRARLAGSAAHGREREPVFGRQAALFEQASAALRTIARRQPLLLILDDLQWADTGSVSLLFHLGRQIGDCPILVACAYRPADLKPSAGQRHPLLPVVHEFQRVWGEVVLDLDRVAGDSFVNAYVDSEPNRLDKGFRTRLLQAGGGNALFTVEMVQSLQERGYLTRDAAGRWVAGSTLDWGRTPVRTEAIVAERVDRLPADWRAILDAACVVGEEFDADLVADALEVDEGAVRRVMSGPLSKQQRLVRLEGLRFGPDGQQLARYAFRHGLVQQYLYAEMDEAERAGLHGAIGRTLEARCSGKPNDLSPRLAWHFEEAGALDKAAAYCLAAGDRAVRLCAYEDAIGHYLRGLDLLARVPETDQPALRESRLRCELSLCLGMGRTSGATRGWANAEQIRIYERAYEVARELVNRTDVGADIWHAFLAQIDSATGLGEFRQALVLANHLFDLARQSGTPLAMGLAHWGMGLSLFCQGACESAREHLEEAVALYFGHRESFPVLSGMDAGVNCLAWLSVTLCVLGFPEQGLARGNEAVRLAEDLALPFSQGMALAVAGCALSMYRRDVPGSQRRAVELLALSQEKGAPFLRQWVELTLGWVQVENGEYEAGCDRIKRTIQSWRQMGTVFGSIWHLALLADAHRGAGQVEQGLARVEDAMALLPRMGFSHQEPELHRIRGELLQAKGEPAQEVEACFQRAIEVARRHGTRWFELRAMVSLARFRRTADAARRQEAREMLAGVYAWFSEGFDLPNMVEARELLAEL